MGHRDTRGLTIRVRDLKRSRALYRRLGFVEADAPDGHTSRLQSGDVALVLTDRDSVRGESQPEASTASDHPGGGVALTIVVRDLDDVLAYWLEEGMLVVTAVQQDRTGRVFHGLDHDGYELRIEERATQ